MARGIVTIGLFLALAAPAGRATPPDAALTLAQDRGCFVCHEVGSGPPPVAQVLPTAPSFRDIARRYRGQPGAAERLTQTVVNGTPGEGGRHWQNQVAGSVMFGDHIVSEEEARALVAWILAMDARPSADKRGKARR